MSNFGVSIVLVHDDVIKWKHFPRYWPFVQGFHRSPVISPHKGQWREALMFSLICARINHVNGWVNNGEAGDLTRHRAHYDVIVMCWSGTVRCADIFTHRDVNIWVFIDTFVCRRWDPNARSSDSSCCTNQKKYVGRRVIASLHDNNCKIIRNRHLMSWYVWWKYPISYALSICCGLVPINFTHIIRDYLNGIGFEKSVACWQ